LRRYQAAFFLGGAHDSRRCNTDENIYHSHIFKVVILQTHPFHRRSEDKNPSDNGDKHGNSL
jgi:hypothetical protein